MFERERRYLDVGMKRAYQWVRESWRRQHGRSDVDDIRTVLEGVSDDLTVCFLCYGNICRSPFAERYLELRADTEKVTVVSAGAYDEEGRPSPDTAIAVASEFGVELESHRSRTMDRGVLRRADLVFLMDYENHFDLRRRYPRLQTPVFLLGALTDEEPASIPDPFGGDRREFRETYHRIATAVDKFTDLVEQTRSESDHRNYRN